MEYPGNIRMNTAGLNIVDIDAGLLEAIKNKVFDTFDSSGVHYVRSSIYGRRNRISSRIRCSMYMGEIMKTHFEFVNDVANTIWFNIRKHMEMFALMDNKNKIGHSKENNEWIYAVVFDNLVDEIITVPKFSEMYTPDYDKRSVEFAVLSYVDVIRRDDPLINPKGNGYQNTPDLAIQPRIITSNVTDEF